MIYSTISTKVILFVFKSVNILASHCLSELCVYSPSWFLRSVDQLLLNVPKTAEARGDGVLAAPGPKL